jgi:hypothetical protein
MHAYIFCYPDSLATAVPEEFCPAPLTPDLAGEVIAMRDEIDEAKRLAPASTKLGRI